MEDETKRKLFQEIWLRVYLSVASSGLSTRDPIRYADEALEAFKERFHPERAQLDDDIPF